MTADPAAPNQAAGLPDPTDAADPADTLAAATDTVTSAAPPRAASALITDSAAAFADALTPSGRLIGLDLGTRTIGIAVSDVTRMIASPVETLRRTKFRADAAALIAVIEAQRAVGLVLGLPRNLDGSEGPRAQSTRAFARNIAGLVTVPILMWDERLTTAEAERVLIAADQSRKRRAEVIDKMAAGIILQGALDRLAML